MQLKCRTAARSCQLTADNALSAETAYAIEQQTGITYFSGAFVFDGELTLLFAVIDVAQLVIKEIRGRHREPSEKHREQGREATHPSAEPEHLKPWREEERRVPLWRCCWCG